MRNIRLVWDDDTTDHVARHDVEPEEAEEVCWRQPLVLRTRQGRYIVLGQTEAGRYLTVIAARLSGSRMKLITARDMTESERRRYRQR